MTGILSVTVPIFLFVAAGYTGRKKNFITVQIRDFLSKSVYYFAMPALIVRSILSFDFSMAFDLDLVAHNLLVTFFVCIVTFAAAYLIKEPGKRGAFNMSCFRSNQGYMGLPLINGFYGNQAVSKTAVINGFDSPFSILLSVLVLEIYNSKKSTRIRLLFSFVTNPLVLAAFVSLFLSYYGVQVLKIGIVDEFLKIAGHMALPLALISIGASLRIRGIKKNIRLLAVSASVKLFLMPITAYLLAYHAFGFRGEDLGLSVILTSTPTAVSSYVMAGELGADEEFMATSVGITTFASVVTITLIKYILG